MDSLSQATETMAESVQEINTKIISMGSMIESIVANTEHLNASSDNMLSANEEAAGCINNIPGGGNGNPCQYSYLGDPMDRRPWWAAVHRVSKSQTQFSSVQSFSHV